MSMGIRIVAEYYDMDSGEVLKSTVLRTEEINKPTTLKEFGFLHADQIQLLESIQNFKLVYETQLINDDTGCPSCGRKTSRRGTRESNFHAALTDHKITIQRRSCECGWQIPDTVDGIYGSSLHPDLVEKQAIQGAENSYRQASRQLNAESKGNRRINNDDRIRNNIADVAEMIEEGKLKKQPVIKINDAAKQLVTVIDGGHIKSNDDTRSFEAMIVTVYRPENSRTIDKHHNEITQKTSVASVRSDKQKTIKQLAINACRKEGTNASITELTCLTDGASNCWSIAQSLKLCCKKLINVLDWFHITKRFTIINNRIDDDFQEKLEKVKWFLWHGKAQSALDRLTQLQSLVEDEVLLSSLQALHEYIERNQKYITNYQERKANNLPFTSTLAESSVNTLINDRQKNNKKMQWSREGAHHILQIRASRFSKTWKDDWQAAQDKMYLKAA